MFETVMPKVPDQTPHNATFDPSVIGFDEQK